MKKLLHLVFAGFLFSLILTACGSPDTGNGKGGGSSNLTAPIVAETFAGQVYYLDGDGRAVDIDTSRDRIVFDDSGYGYELFIGEKSYKGTYTVDLLNKEINLTGTVVGQTENTFSGTLGFSSDAKNVELNAVETAADGSETLIEKTGTIKWDWSELGEWINKEIKYGIWTNTYCTEIVKKESVKFWKGQIDFTNSAYTRGIKIPAAVFANIKAGDAITFVMAGDDGFKGFLNLKTTNGSFLYLSGFPCDNFITRCNYTAVVCTINQNNLNSIQQNGGLEIFGNNSSIEGIILSSGSTATAAFYDIFCNEYSAYYSDESNNINYRFWIDTEKDNCEIEFSWRKEGEKDARGMDILSPDKNIYREYRWHGKLNELTSSIQMDEMQFEYATEDNCNLQYYSNNVFYYLNQSVSAKVPFTFNFSTIANGECTVSFNAFPSVLNNYLPEAAQTLTLKLDIYQINYDGDPINDFTFDSLDDNWTSKSGTITFYDEDTGSDKEKAYKVLKRSVSLDYSDAGKTKGFKIPATVFSELGLNDESVSIGLIFGDPKPESYDELFEMISCSSATENSRCYSLNKENGYATIWTTNGSLLVNNYLSALCDKCIIEEIVIGEMEAIDFYCYEKLNSD